MLLPVALSVAENVDQMFFADNAKLMDFYTLFYHRFGKRRTTDDHLWRNLLNNPNFNVTEFDNIRSESGSNGKCTFNKK